MIFPVAIFMRRRLIRDIRTNFKQHPHEGRCSISIVELKDAQDLFNEAWSLQVISKPTVDCANDSKQI